MLTKSMTCRPAPASYSTCVVPVIWWCSTPPGKLMTFVECFEPAGNRLDQANREEVVGWPVQPQCRDVIGGGPDDHEWFGVGHWSLCHHNVPPLVIGQCHSITLDAGSYE